MPPTGPPRPSPATTCCSWSTRTAPPASPSTSASTSGRSEAGAGSGAAPAVPLRTLTAVTPARALAGRRAAPALGRGTTMRTLLFAALVLGIAATSRAQHQGHEPAPAAGASPQEPHQHPGTHDPEHMTGFFGRYPMTREASGTSWQPDSTPMQGRHFTRGDWMLMAHASADLVYDRQGGP